MQPAALMKPDLQRHSYSLIFFHVSGVTHLIRALCDLGLIGSLQRLWIRLDVAMIVKKTKENTKFKKNSGLF
jgi:hypothetical protein